MKSFIFTLLSILTSWVVAGDYSLCGANGVDFSHTVYACSAPVEQTDHSDSDDIDYHVNDYHFSSTHCTYLAHQSDAHEKALVAVLYGYHTRAPPVKA